MADMTLVQAIVFLEGLPKKIGEKGTEVMRDEFNHKDRPYATGETSESFHYEVYGDLIFIGSGTKGAYYVEKGRKEVKPVRAKMLRWQAAPNSSEYVFAMRSSAVKPDNYIERTARRLKSMDFH